MRCFLIAENTHANLTTNTGTYQDNTPGTGISMCLRHHPQCHPEHGRYHYSGNPPGRSLRFHSVLPHSHLCSDSHNPPVSYYTQHHSGRAGSHWHTRLCPPHSLYLVINTDN